MFEWDSLLICIRHGFGGGRGGAYIKEVQALDRAQAEKGLVINRK